MLALFGALISDFGRMIPIRMLASVLAVQGMIGVGFFLTATLQDLAVRVGLPATRAASALRRIVGLPCLAWGLYLGHTGWRLRRPGSSPCRSGKPNPSRPCTRARPRRSALVNSL